MNATCPWCDEPSAPGKLCDGCAEADLSVRMCPALPPGYTAHLGYIGCGVDPHLAAQEKAREKRAASLREIFLQCLRDMGRRWEGFEFAKAWAAEACLVSMEAAGLSRAEEFDRGLAALTSEEYGRLRCYVGGLPTRAEV